MPSFPHLAEAAIRIPSLTAGTPPHGGDSLIPSKAKKSLKQLTNPAMSANSLRQNENCAENPAQTADYYLKPRMRAATAKNTDILAGTAKNNDKLAMTAEKNDKLAMTAENNEMPATTANLAENHANTAKVLEKTADSLTGHRLPAESATARDPKLVEAADGSADTANTKRAAAWPSATATDRREQVETAANRCKPDKTADHPATTANFRNIPSHLQELRLQESFTASLTAPGVPLTGQERNFQLALQEGYDPKAISTPSHPTPTIAGQSINPKLPMVSGSPSSHPLLSGPTADSSPAGQRIQGQKEKTGLDSGFGVSKEGSLKQPLIPTESALTHNTEKLLTAPGKQTGDLSRPDFFTVPTSMGQNNMKQMSDSNLDTDPAVLKHPFGFSPSYKDSVGPHHKKVPLQGGPDLEALIGSEPYQNLRFDHHTTEDCNHRSNSSRGAHGPGVGQVENRQKSCPIANEPNNFPLQGGLQGEAKMAFSSAQNLGSHPPHLEDCRQTSNLVEDAQGLRVEQSKGLPILGHTKAVAENFPTQGTALRGTFQGNSDPETWYEHPTQPGDCGLSRKVQESAHVSWVGQPKDDLNFAHMKSIVNDSHPSSYPTQRPIQALNFNQTLHMSQSQVLAHSLASRFPQEASTQRVEQPRNMPKSLPMGQEDQTDFQGASAPGNAPLELRTSKDSRSGPLLRPSECLFTPLNPKCT
jgi:hypothetical protein